MNPSLPCPPPRRQLPWLDGNSHYVDSAHGRPELAPLRGAASVDACVVGAGIAGLCAAIELARAGLQVCVLEARRVGAGASGRNGGQALGDYACGIEWLERALGAAGAERAWELSQDALRRLRLRLREFAIDCDWRDGALSVARGPRQAAKLHAAMLHRRQRYGASHLRWLGEHELRTLLRSQAYCGGVLDPLGGHLHPLNYTLGLARAARALGVRMHEHSRVSRLRHDAGSHRLEGAGWQLRCRRLLLAAGAVPGAPSQHLRRRVLPLASCMLATQPLRELAPPCRFAVCDTDFVPDYFRLDPEGRLLFGSGAHAFAGRALRDPAQRRERLRAAMLRVFPDLREAHITHDWGGWIDVSLNRAPDFGRLGASLVYLQGFSGHGLALSGLAGELGARALLEGPGACPDFELFAGLRHASLPQSRALRIPIAALGSLWGRFLHTS